MIQSPCRISVCLHVYACVCVHVRACVYICEGERLPLPLPLQAFAKLYLFQNTLYMTFYLQDGRTSLVYASRAGYVECVKALLEGGAQATPRDEVCGLLQTYHN